MLQGSLDSQSSCTPTRSSALPNLADVLEPGPISHFADPRRKLRHRGRKRLARGPQERKRSPGDRMPSRPRPPVPVSESCRRTPRPGAHPGPRGPPAGLRAHSQAERGRRSGGGGAGPSLVRAWIVGLGGHLCLRRDPPVLRRPRPQQRRRVASGSTPQHCAGAEVHTCSYKTHTCRC